MANYFTLGILASMMTLGLCTPLRCPTLEDMRPCTCKHLGFGLSVICAGFNNSSALTKVCRILKGYKIQTVLLHGLNIDKALPKELFDGVEIKEIRIEQSRLVFDHPAFSGLDHSLNVLNVAKQSVVKSVNRFSIAKLSELHKLSVQSNQMLKIENSFLSGKVPKLQVLELDDNAIAEVEDKAFESLALLEKISLAQNSITDMRRSMLPNPAYKLERIDLSLNKISKFPSDFFNGMPQLSEIILIKNELTVLPETTWMPVWENLAKVFLSGNNLICNDDMTWIKNKKMPHLDGCCAFPEELEGKALKDVYYGA